MIIPKIWKNKKCSKPPISNELNLILSKKKIRPMSRAPRHGVLFDPPIGLPLWVDA